METGKPSRGPGLELARCHPHQIMLATAHRMAKAKIRGWGTRAAVRRELPSYVAEGEDTGKGRESGPWIPQVRVLWLVISVF